MKREVTFLLTV